MCAAFNHPYNSAGISMGVSKSMTQAFFVPNRCCDVLSGILGYIRYAHTKNQIMYGGIGVMVWGIGGHGTGGIGGHGTGGIGGYRGACIEGRRTDGPLGLST